MDQLSNNFEWLRYPLVERQLIAIGIADVELKTPETRVGLSIDVQRVLHTGARGNGTEVRARDVAAVGTDPGRAIAAVPLPRDEAEPYDLPGAEFLVFFAAGHKSQDEEGISLHAPCHRGYLTGHAPAPPGECRLTDSLRVFWRSPHQAKD